MPPRIFLVHGYVEDPTIFDGLVPLLPPANYVRINLADEFARWQPTGSINVRLLAQQLIDRYQITGEDVVIGHSMGGWTAIYIKQLTGATIVQVASWTDSKKILFPTANLTILKLLLDSGLTRSQALNNVFKKRYPFPESFALYGKLLDGSVRMSRSYLWQQLQTLFAKVPAPIVQPDLRIHTRVDSIIAPPNESFIEVPGDHFSLVFHAEAVAKPIRTILESRQTIVVA